MTSTIDPYAKVKAELAWLKAHPEFEERPATIREFIGPEYLNIEGRVREAIMVELIELFGDTVDGHKIAKYSKGMITGGIGIGKTTVASIVLPYLAHWVLCIRDPQKFFNLLPGSRIAFMQMSTSGPQAKEVVFGDIKARIQYSPWFSQKYPYETRFKNQLRFPKDIWILPGDSAETTFEGYNILGGILDEADSHQVTKNKDYAEQGYDTIHARISSRFGNQGFILVIGQMKKANGFAAKKYKEFQKDPTAHAVRMTIWESLGWDHFLKMDGSRDSFWYDIDRKEIVSDAVQALIPNSENLIEVPTVYRGDFENNPEKALRDLAGIPPATGSPFISLTYKIKEAQERYVERFGGYETPVNEKGQFEDWFTSMEPIKRVVHLDMAFSGEGDALGMAMGHVPEVIITPDGERKPYIVIDMLMRIHAPAGREISLADVRRLIYALKDDKKFRIVKVTMDGFQSTDTRQQMEKRRIESEIVSVDKQTLPYEDLREAIYDNRIAFPRYMVRLRADDSQLTDIAYKELSELVDEGGKIDHPSDGSKDVADAMAGVVYTLMGERQYHRKVTRMDQWASQKATGTNGPSSAMPHPAMRDLPLHAPVPPPTGGLGLWNPRLTGR